MATITEEQYKEKLEKAFRCIGIIAEEEFLMNYIYH